MSKSILEVNLYRGLTVGGDWPGQSMRGLTEMESRNIETQAAQKVECKNSADEHAAGQEQT